jgi:cyclohexanecarboxylate-CoA ligase/acyl-CoA synthetase
VNAATSSDDFAPQSWWREETLRDWMDARVQASPSAPALIGAGGTLSYGGLHKRAFGLGESLRELGVGQGDVIAVQLPNIAEFIIAYLAAGYLGATLQTIHMPYRAAEVEPLLRHGGAKAFICMAQAKDFFAAEMALSLKPRLPKLQHVIAVGEDAPEGALAFPQSAGTTDGGYRPAAADRFLLLYTSGTVAAPKGVPVVYKRFLAHARLSEASVILSAAPFTHLYGLYSVNMALAVGGAIALLPAFAPDVLAEALDRYKPTAVFTAPAHMAACLNGGLLTPQRLSSLAFVMISGTVCPPELARKIQAMMPNGKVCQLWGMSEMQAGTFTRPGDDEAVRVTSAGRASPGTQLRVVNEGKAVAVGEEGELQARGCSVFDGYLANDDATVEAFTADGWFRTGDLARADAGGNIVITGRLKDVINRGGVKFNPADVEAVIDRHASVAQCAVAGIPDPLLGERACCFAVLKPNASLDLETLKAWLADNGVSKMKWPERLEIVAEMPLTPTRKIKKAELLKRLG